MKNEFIKRVTTSLFIIILLIFLLSAESIFFNIFLLIIFFISIYEWKKLSLNNLIFSFGVLIISISFLSAYYLRKDYYFFFIMVLIISIFSDIGGYTFGKIFKGPKLTKISPNKTFSGMFGSFFFSLIIGYFYTYSNLIFLNIIKFDFNLLKTFILIMVISSVNQLGDLLISYFKRLNNKQDTGKILPGHGGLLDRIDGMVFSIPVGFLLVKFF